MRLIVEVSLGELIDKLSILHIKLIKIKDKTKNKNVLKECNMLRKTLNFYILKYKMDKDYIQDILEQMTIVNSKIWDIEDNIRKKEKSKSYDSEFIELARSVYYTNDERFKIKQEINNKYDSDIKEEKDYEEYK